MSTKPPLQAPQSKDHKKQKDDELCEEAADFALLIDGCMHGKKDGPAKSCRAIPLVECLDDEVAAADEDGDTNQERYNKSRHDFLLCCLLAEITPSPDFGFAHYDQ